MLLITRAGVAGSFRTWVKRSSQGAAAPFLIRRTGSRGCHGFFSIAGNIRGHHQRRHHVFWAQFEAALGWGAAGNFTRRCNMEWIESSGAEESLERGPLDIATIRRNRPNWQALLPRRVEWDVASVTVQALLDRVLDQIFSSQTTSAAMAHLVSGLWAVKLATDEDGWERSIRQCRAHPIARVLHQDPFARARTASRADIPATPC